MGYWQFTYEWTQYTNFKTYCTNQQIKKSEETSQHLQYTQTAYYS